MQFSMQIWTRESQAACLAHEKHVQIVGNSKIYFTILISFYHHIVALRWVAARACAKQAADFWDNGGNCEAPKARSFIGTGGMLPQKISKSRRSEMPFLAFPGWYFPQTYSKPN